MIVVLDATLRCSGLEGIDCSSASIYMMSIANQDMLLTKARVGRTCRLQDTRPDDLNVAFEMTEIY